MSQLKFLRIGKFQQACSRVLSMDQICTCKHLTKYNESRISLEKPTVTAPLG